MNDILAFRKNIAPILVKVIFWLGTIACVLGGVAIIATISYYRITQTVLGGLALILLGPAVLRIWAEVVLAILGTSRMAADLRDVVVREAYERFEEKHGHSPV